MLRFQRFILIRSLQDESPHTCELLPQAVQGCVSVSVGEAVAVILHELRAMHPASAKC